MGTDGSPRVLLVTTDLSGTRSQSCLRCHLLTSQPAEQTPQEVFWSICCSAKLALGWAEEGRSLCFPIAGLSSQPRASTAFLPVGLPNLRLLVNQHHAEHVNIRPRRRNPPRTQRTTLRVNVNILFSHKRKSHLEEKRRVKCRAQTEKADSENEA